MPSPAEYAEQERFDKRMAERDELRAENERLRAVAEAARDILEVLHWNPQMHPKIVALGVALSALDAGEKN